MLKPIKLKNFFKNKKITYYKFGLGLKNEKIIDLQEVFDKHENFNKIFLKIDIEKDEYRLLDCIANNFSRLNGLVIEFHDIDLHIKKIENFIHKFKCDIVHVHANNAGPLNKDDNPTILEFSFAKNAEKLSLKENIKHKLDEPNIKNKKDIDLIFEK